MYNDEHNLYHYTYRKDGTEHTAEAPTAGPAVYREPWEAKPERK